MLVACCPIKIEKQDSYWQFYFMSKPPSDGWVMNLSFVYVNFAVDESLKFIAIDNFSIRLLSKSQ